MKRKAGVMIAAILICLMCSMPVWTRAGGGGGGSGSGGSSGSGGGSFSGSSSDASGSQSGNVVGVFVQGMFLLVLASGGSIVLIWKGRKAKRRSRQAMKVFAQMGDNWDAKEIQRQVEEAYFQIQECWRRMDISYGAPYLSEELQKEFDSKIQWMVIRNEEVIQKNVRLLRAMPVSVQDEPGEWCVERPDQKHFLSIGNLCTVINGGCFRKSGSKMRWILTLWKIPKARFANWIKRNDCKPII